MLWSLLIWAGFLLFAGFAAYAWIYNHKHNMDSLDNAVPIPLTIAAVLLFIVAISFSIGVGMSGATCERLGDSLDINTQYQVAGGCYVEYDDRLVPESWLVPVIEGNRLRIEIQNPQG